jgi:hypothetical protein
MDNGIAGNTTVLNVKSDAIFEMSRQKLLTFSVFRKQEFSQTFIYFGKL